MSLKEDLDTLDPAEEVQKAFTDSAAIKFAGVEMHPWTTARHSAALILGCEIMANVGAAVNQLLTKGHYPNMLKDVVIAMWVCSLPAKDVQRINYSSGEDDVTAAFDWAEKVGLTYGTPLYVEGVKMIIKINREINASHFSVEPRDGAEPFKKSVTRQPGKSSSVGRQRKLAGTPPNT
jgi:hypothetical protein